MSGGFRHAVRSADIAWCPRHGLHGEREECVVCGKPVHSIPMVEANWYGLLAILEAHYPESVFTGESGDIGAHLIALARVTERLAAYIEEHIEGSQVYRESGVVVT